MRQAAPIIPGSYEEIFTQLVGDDRRVSPIFQKIVNERNKDFPNQYDAQIVRARLNAEKIANDSNEYFPADSASATWLDYDQISYATQFFIGDEALVIGRSATQFGGENSNFSDVAEIIRHADLSNPKNRFIAFPDYSGSHFMSAVIDTETRHVYFTDSMNGGYSPRFDNFKRRFEETLLPALREKFDRGEERRWTTIPTATNERVQQCD